MSGHSRERDFGERTESMTEHNPLLTRRRLLALLAAGFVMAHLVLFHILRHLNAAQTLIPGALLSVLFLLAVAKHLGLLVILLRRLYSVFDRRDGSPNPRR